MSIIPISQDDHTALMAAVGEALAEWAKVELGVGLMFAVLSRCSERARVGAIWDGIVAFEARMTVVDRLMAVEGLDELELEMWARTSARVRKFYKKRHEVAHFRVVAAPGKGKNKIGKPLISPYFTWEKWLTQTGSELDLNQIKERTAKFEELNHAMLWWAPMMGVRAMPEARPSPDNEEPPLIARIRDQASQILEERKQSPQLRQG